MRRSFPSLPKTLVAAIVLAASLTTGSVAWAAPTVPVSPSPCMERGSGGEVLANTHTLLWPRIGITGLRSAQDDVKKLQTYWAAIERAGGTPVALYYGDPVDARALDGIVFAGGEDVDPTLYGEKPHPTVKVNADRDRSEMAQADSALQQQLPILGICRGSQLLNVRLGGSLVQDIPSQVTGALPHKAGSFHAVIVQPGTRLAQTVSLHKLTVNSYHHQAVKKLADGLQINARSDDGVIEGWEAKPGGPIPSFVTGVQFHPEKPDFPDSGFSQEVFAAFIAEARAFHQRKLATGSAPAAGASR
jgi:putative glutamine amidotransferase